MAHVLITDVNPNHPCADKDCNECETCIFDKDLFLEEKQIKRNMPNFTSCHLCENLVKNYVGDNRIQFNACCGRYIVMFNGFSRPRVIKHNTGPMLPLTTPEWCPKNRGITQMNVSSEVLQEEPQKSLLARISTSEETQEPKRMTIAEKREKLMMLPKRLEWDDIKEGCIYVIPKILSQSRKVVRVILKTETLLRCSEIDEYGNESQLLFSVYPKDIDMVFMTKILKY